MPVTGPYTGQLNNAGEHVLLADGRGATILDFTYDDTGPGWHPSTDGLGYSLVIIDEQAPPSTWNDPASWRPSSHIGGSPGSADTAPGDIDGNLRIDLMDLAIMQSHFGLTTGASRSQGDLNGDGAVNRADAAILAGNFGRSVVATPLSPAASIAASARDRNVARATSEVSSVRARRRVYRPGHDASQATLAATDQALSAGADDHGLLTGRRARLSGRR
jgi:hypothetical protein